MGQPIMSQGTNEGLRAPMAKRCVIDKALAARSPAGRLGHIGLDRGFINESQSFQMVGHERLAFCDPDAAQVGDILALLLKRLEIFFCASGRGRAAPARLCRDAR